MNEEILINLTPQETRVALVQQGAVQELHVERTLSRGRVGNIYLGKVVRVLPGMQSAFIDIGLERAAFLHVADIWHPRLVGEPQSGTPHQPIAITTTLFPIFPFVYGACFSESSTWSSAAKTKPKQV